jgi:hypothetical protein
MNWEKLLDFKITDEGILTLELGPVLLILAGVVLIVFLWRVALSGRALFRRWEAIEADVRLGGIGSVKLRPNMDDVQIAHRAWVELATRKAALPFDRENDVIAEIYNSWYELFDEMRRLAKEFPAHKLRTSQDSPPIVDLIVEALNRGLRPHLTRWQARFRRWYEKALEEHPDESPQEVQRLYPEYEELVADLELVSGDLIQYMGVLKRVVIGEKGLT